MLDRWRCGWRLRRIDLGDDGICCARTGGFDRVERVGVRGGLREREGGWCGRWFAAAAAGVDALGSRRVGAGVVPRFEISRMRAVVWIETTLGL